MYSYNNMIFQKTNYMYFGLALKLLKRLYKKNNNKKNTT